MQIIPRSGTENSYSPLPIFNAIHIADAISKDNENFKVFKGLEKQYTIQLKRFSLSQNDVELQKNTGDRKRFGEGSYEDWYKNKRTPFCLVHEKTNALAALIWFGPKPLGKKSIKFEEKSGQESEGNWHTVAYRSYIPFRGKGIMKYFTQFVMDAYKKEFPDVKIWAGMDNRNTAVVKLNTELGFKVKEEASDLSNNWLVMARE